MTELIIFDLDMTLANCEHRRHFVDLAYIKDNPYEFFTEFQITKEGARRGWLHNITGEKFVPNWKEFHEACSEDTPIEPVTELLYILSYKYEIQIWSGRCESVREKTDKWRRQYAPTFYSLGALKMRPVGDNTPYDQLKERWLDEELAKGNTVKFVVDDRRKVRDMWIRRGIFVFDVSQGKGDF